jgi:hypothetical protein
VWSLASVWGHTEHATLRGRDGLIDPQTDVHFVRACSGFAIVPIRYPYLTLSGVI